MGRFYPWASYEVVSTMDPEVVEMYWQGITVLEAQEALRDLKVVSFPHGKEEDRKTYHKQLKKMAYTRREEDVEVLPIDEFVRRITEIENGK